MQQTKTNIIRFIILSMVLSCSSTFLVAGATSTFQLRTRCTVNGINGPQGWASTMYNHSVGKTNQSLQISFRGLNGNQVYHLTASWGTNGQLMHLSDFVCNRSGAIMMQHVVGAPHHFAGTNNPAPGWNIVCDWTNRMSGVIFPGLTTNWCSPMHEDALSALKSMDGGMNGMGDHGGMGGSMHGWDDHGNWDDHGGIDDHGGMGDMCHGWPASTNWWDGMTNWWGTMNSWCWDYTNAWNSGSATNEWWCSWRRSASHTMPLPPSIDPVPVINGLVVCDDHLQPVLTADLATPDSFTYYVRCDFTNHGLIPGAECTLQASATKRASRFALSASGLSPRTSCSVEFDGTIGIATATDRYGRLNIRELPVGVDSIRGVGTITITDDHSHVILSAHLPPE